MNQKSETLLFFYIQISKIHSKKIEEINYLLSLFLMQCNLIYFLSFLSFWKIIMQPLISLMMNFECKKRKIKIYENVERNIKLRYSCLLLI